MSPTGRTLATVAAAALLGAVLGGGVVWLVQRNQIATLERAIAARADALESERVTSLQKTLDERDRTIEQLTERVDDLTSASDSAAPKPKPTKTEKQFAYIRRLVYAHPGQMSADYAQFLTGEAAAEAAKKAGAESPPPNDYYIVNENPKLRRLPVHPNAEVRLSSKPGEGFIAEGYDSDVKTLAKYLSTDTEDTASLRSNGYWLTLNNGVVVAIEEQYTP